MRHGSKQAGLIHSPYGHSGINDVYNNQLGTSTSISATTTSSQMAGRRVGGSSSGSGAVGAAGGIDMLQASMLAAAAVQSTDIDTECDIRTLNLAHWQMQLIYNTLATPSLLNPMLLAKAKLTHLEITPYLVYRYYASQQWGRSYSGQNYDTAIIANVHWRMQFGIQGRGIHDVQTAQFAHLIRYGFGYTGGWMD